jgi:hypothetical protein
MGLAMKTFLIEGTTDHLRLLRRQTFVFNPRYVDRGTLKIQVDIGGEKLLREFCEFRGLKIKRVT